VTAMPSGGSGGGAVCWNGASRVQGCSNGKGRGGGVNHSSCCSSGGVASWSRVQAKKLYKPAMSFRHMPTVDKRGVGRERAPPKRSRTPTVHRCGICDCVFVQSSHKPCTNALQALLH
jgi:hypothetical protein